MGILRVGRQFAVLVALTGLGIAGPAVSQTFTYHQDHVLGTSIDVTIASADKREADLAWKAILNEVSRLDALISTWRPDSEISRLNTERAVTASPETGEVLVLCRHWRQETDGAVDCRIGNILDAWNDVQSGEALGGAVLASLVAEARSSDVSISGSKAKLSGTGTLRLDSLAKGWIIDAAVEQAKAEVPLIEGVAVDIGGDLRVSGSMGAEGLRVGIAGPNAADNDVPQEVVLLKNEAIASSGTGKRDLKIAGQSVSHIISPKTGAPQTKIHTATVIAPDAATADALATAFGVMGVGNSLGYANAHDGIEAMIVTTGGGRFSSDGWGDRIAPMKIVSASEAGIENPLPEGWSVNVDYNVPKIRAGDYEYPYVAAWVTDAESKPVRLLLLLGDSPRWIEENYIYWRRVGRKNAAVIDHVARPTRPPGSYSLVWDGRDEHGRPVEQGEYILHVEASREHGGHQYEKLTLSLRDQVVSATSEPGSELGAVRASFGPR